VQSSLTALGLNVYSLTGGGVRTWVPRGPEVQWSIDIPEYGLQPYGPQPFRQSGDTLIGTLDGPIIFLSGGNEHTTPGTARSSRPFRAARYTPPGKAINRISRAAG
jgi:hypothetical protein